MLGQIDWIRMIWPQGQTDSLKLRRFWNLAMIWLETFTEGASACGFALKQIL